MLAPAYTFFATVSPLLALGAHILQVDCLTNGNIDPSRVEPLITEHVKALVITHMWGYPCDMGEIVRICKKHSLKLIEDCSHAHGGSYNDMPLGSFGDVSVWSLQGQKNITGGEGGILLTDDKDIFSRALLIGHYNKRALQQIDSDSKWIEFAGAGLGNKLRAHPLAIAIANQQLSYLEEWQVRRQKTAQHWISALTEFPFLNLPVVTGGSHAWYAFVFNYDPQLTGIDADKLSDAFAAERLFELDRPKSTNLLSKYKSFTDTHMALPRLYKMPALSNPYNEDYEANRFVSTAFKLPVWCFDADWSIVEQYADGLRKVLCHVQRGNSL